MTQQHPNDAHTLEQQSHLAAAQQPEAHPTNKAVYRGNRAMLATLGLLDDEHDAPLPQDDTNQFISLSQALTGNDRLQAHLITDYLSDLSTEETHTVANLLAEDTLAMLNTLAEQAEKETKKSSQTKNA